MAQADPPGIGRFTQRFEYAIPGDLSSRTRSPDGSTVTGAGVGLVFHEVGIKAIDIDDNVLLVHGPHPIHDEGAWLQVCDAFAAMGAEVSTARIGAVRPRTAGPGCARAST
jgi:hypothetical protein